MRAVLLFSLASFLFSCSSPKQMVRDGKYRAAFYNVENLFDTINDPDTRDGAFTPEGSKKWSASRYETKLNRIGQVIEALGFPELFGLAEVENKIVLRDLIAVNNLEEKKYRIVHHNSPDERGIDVALLYREDAFELLNHQPIRIELHPSVSEDPNTRDILEAEFSGNGDTVMVYINHWPSRIGGLAASAPKRKAAARALRGAIQNEMERSPSSCFIAMGDFNDEPRNRSIDEVLRAGSVPEVTRHEVLFYHPGLEIDERNEGTYNYRGTWNLLDQMMFSSCFIDRGCSTLPTFEIFKPDWLLYFTDYADEGRPNRTYGGSTYYGGYSDHLPVYSDFSFCN